MEQFSYSFAVSMMHSLWQTGLLLGCYFIISAIIKNASPLFKRNLLFSLIAAQLLSSIVTFIFYWSSSFENIEQSLNNLLQLPFLKQAWLQTYSAWLFYGYSAVVFFKIVSYFYSWVQFKKTYNTGLIRPSADLKIFTANKVHHVGVKRNVSIWFSEHITTPVAFGFFKPMILLPIALINQLSVEETEALIVHEIAHIKSNDYLLNLLLIATETLYYFNPFVKIIANKIRLEREKNCDVQVLDFNYDHISYADALLKTARLQQKLNVFQLAATAGQAQLLKRIHFFATENNHNRSAKNKTPFAICCLLVFLSVNIFTVLKLTSKAPPEVTVSLVNVVAPQGLPYNKVSTSEVITGPPIIANATPAVALKKQQGIKLKTISIEKNIEAVDVEPAASAEFIATPVALVDQPTTQVHDVLINEESSTGKQVTKAYRVHLKDGKWIAEPLWLTAEVLPTRSASDSLKPKPDSTYRLMPPAF